MTETAPRSPQIFPRTFPHIAALVSWMAPLAGLILGNFARRATGARAWQMLSLPFIAAGILLALYALTQMRKHGAKGLLVNAVVGLAISGALAGMFWLMFRSKSL